MAHQESLLDGISWPNDFVIWHVLLCLLKIIVNIQGASNEKTTLTIVPHVLYVFEQKHISVERETDAGTH